jgi:PhnB protein
MGHQPQGYHTVIPYITVDDPAAALGFYERAFGAETTLKLMMGGQIGHAEFRIGDSHVMLSGEWPQMGIRGPKALDGTAVRLSVYVPDVDTTFARAVAAGATPDREPQDEFYGDRMGAVTDPFGHRWMLHTHIRDVSDSEMQAAMDAMAAQMCQPQPG